MKPVFYILPLVVGVLSAREGDRIQNMPGLHPQPTFSHYSGYLDAANDNKLFYWFVESENNPSTDPVLLWLNGGPGCSSLQGLLMEIGPFRINEDGKTLSYFKYRWNMIASILFLETPVGVGYSHNKAKNYSSSDDLAALNNHLALRSFFEAFPEYKNNDFFVAGESYGGVLVPALCARLVDDPNIKFKGFAVGNPVTVQPIRDTSLLLYCYSHGLIDEDIASDLMNACCQSHDFNRCSLERSANCSAQIKEKLWTRLWKLNNYNYIKPCERVKYTYKPRSYGRYPCINTEPIETYLNSLEVRNALHVASNVTWGTVCHYDEVTQTYHYQYNNTSSFYKKVLKAGHRVLVYSGDLDMVCDYIGTAAFLESLNLSKTAGYKEWMYVEEDGSNQVAGFVKQYQGLKFVLVKGAGHSVPTDKPKPAFDIFQRFLKNWDY